MPQLRLVLAAVFGLFCFQPLIVVANEPTTSATLSLTSGTLPNGLHYQILPHTAPRGGISLRLVVNAGSLDEHDDERGFAHFVEHMAFNGTTHHPPGTLVELFQNLGLTFGADLNTNTSYTATNYKLDLPEGHTDLLGKSLELLHDYAEGVAFLPAEVEKEKPVILSEIRARDTVATQSGRDMVEAVFAGSLIAEREPIGLLKLIKGATRESLRTFYQRCYRPERMTVIVVGAVDPAKVTEQITTEFGSMPASKDAVAPVEAILPPVAGPVAHIVINPALGTAASFSLLTMLPHTSSTPAGRRQDLVESLTISVLNRRVRERREKNITRFGASGANGATTMNGHFETYAIDVQTAAVWFNEAVALVESELRRARLQGFDEAELKESVETLLTTLRNNVHAVPSLSVQQLAAEVGNTAMAGRPWHSPAEMLAFAESQLPTVTTEDLATTLDLMFPDENIQLMLRVGKPLPDGEHRLLEAYHQSENQPLPKTAGNKGELHFRYENFGPVGKIKADATETDLGLRLATFDNGVRINLRPSPLEPERFRLEAVLGRGILDVPKSKPGFARLAALMCNFNDLGQHSRTEIERLMKLHGVSGRLTVIDNACVANFAGPTEELPFALRLLAATLSDQKLDAARQSLVYSSYSGMLRSIASTPTSLAQLGGRYKLGASDPRLIFPTVDTVKKYRFSELSDWIHECWLEGPIEIGIVGDFKNDDVLAAAAASVGALPPRKASGKNSEPLKFTDTNGKQVTRPKLKAGAATAYLAWPAILPDDPENNRALRLAADVLMDRLRVKLREELGATYSPYVSLYRDRQQRDYGYIFATVTFEPARASALTDRAIALADELAEKGVTAEELERMREPRRSSNAQQMRDNAWWLESVVSYAQSHPDVLAEARGHLTGYDSITAADVNHAAQALREDAVTAVVIVPTPEIATDTKPSDP